MWFLKQVWIQSNKWKRLPIFGKFWGNLSDYQKSNNGPHNFSIHWTFNIFNLLTGCTHFTWRSDTRRCYLKNGNWTREDASQSSIGDRRQVCGFVGTPYQGTDPNWSPDWQDNWAYNCDFINGKYGTDINIFETSGEYHWHAVLCCYMGVCQVRQKQ